jgi:hypothetical protein
MRHYGMIVQNVSTSLPTLSSYCSDINHLHQCQYCTSGPIPTPTRQLLPASESLQLEFSSPSQSPNSSLRHIASQSISGVIILAIPPFHLHTKSTSNASPRYLHITSHPIPCPISTSALLHHPSRNRLVNSISRLCEHCGKLRQVVREA